MSGQAKRTVGPALQEEGKPPPPRFSRLALFPRGLPSPRTVRAPPGCLWRTFSSGNPAFESRPPQGLPSSFWRRVARKGLRYSCPGDSLRRSASCFGTTAIKNRGGRRPWVPSQLRRSSSPPLQAFPSIAANPLGQLAAGKGGASSQVASADAAASPPCRLALTGRKPVPSRIPGKCPPSRSAAGSLAVQPRRETRGADLQPFPAFLRGAGSRAEAA